MHQRADHASLGRGSPQSQDSRRWSSDPVSVLRPLSPWRAHQGRARPGWAGRVRARAPGGAALPIADKGRPADHVVRREEVLLVFPARLRSGGRGAMRGYPGANGCEPR